MAADGKTVQKKIVEYREEQQSSGTGADPVSLLLFICAGQNQSAV